MALDFVQQNRPSEGNDCNNVYVLRKSCIRRKKKKKGKPNFLSTVKYSIIPSQTRNVNLRGFRIINRRLINKRFFRFFSQRHLRLFRIIRRRGLNSRGHVRGEMFPRACVSLSSWDFALYLDHQASGLVSRVVSANVQAWFSPSWPPVRREMIPHSRDTHVRFPAASPSCERCYRPLTGCITKLCKAPTCAINISRCSKLAYTRTCAAHVRICMYLFR